MRHSSMDPVGQTGMQSMQKLHDSALTTTFTSSWTMAPTGQVFSQV